MILISRKLQKPGRNSCLGANKPNKLTNVLHSRISTTFTFCWCRGDFFGWSRRDQLFRAFYITCLGVVVSLTGVWRFALLPGMALSVFFGLDGKFGSLDLVLLWSLPSYMLTGTSFGFRHFRSDSFCLTQLPTLKNITGSFIFVTLNGLTRSGIIRNYSDWTISWFWINQIGLNRLNLFLNWVKLVILMILIWISFGGNVICVKCLMMLLEK